MTESKLILPGDESEGLRLPCQRCGHLMPPLGEELVKMMRSAGGVTLAHDVCPGEEPPVDTRRYFECRVSIIEVTQREVGPFDAGSGGDPASEAVSEELISFVVGEKADDLESSLRPLAAQLGEKWMAAEKNARIADPNPKPTIVT